MSQNSPESESASVPTQMELFPEYELIEQDGFITTHPDLRTLLTNWNQRNDSPEPMETKEGSITFEKND